MLSDWVACRSTGSSGVVYVKLLLVTTSLVAHSLFSFLFHAPSRLWLSR